MFFEEEDTVSVHTVIKDVTGVKINFTTVIPQLIRLPEQCDHLLKELFFLVCSQGSTVFLYVFCLKGNPINSS